MNALSLDGQQESVTMPDLHALTDIVLATDLDPQCDRALLRAFALARGRGARLHIALAVGGDQHPSWDDAKIAERASEDVAALARDAAGGIPWRVLVRREPVTDALVEIAQATGSQLIVTGVAVSEMRHQTRPGRVIDTLIRASRTPVLVVKRPVVGDYGHLVAPTDFSTVSENAIVHGVALFPDSTLTILHAYRLPFAGFLGEGNTQAMLEMATTETLGFAHRLGDRLELSTAPVVHLEEGSPESLLQSLSASRPHDLTVLGVHRPFDLDRYAGDLAGRLLQASTCDVLAVPAFKADSV